jgi:hypothetical protein
MTSLRSTISQLRVDSGAMLTTCVSCGSVIDGSQGDIYLERYFVAEVVYGVRVRKALREGSESKLEKLVK